MNRSSTSLVLAAALAIGVSCNSSNGGTDGGGGSTGGGSGHTGGTGGATGGTGGATGGTGGHGTGGQGGIDNLCLSNGQSCGASGSMCCSGLSCCYGTNGQASCAPGVCTGAQGGPGGGGAAGGAGSSGAAGGSGGEGGAQACFPNGTQCSSANQCCSFTCAGVCTMLVSDRNMKRDFAPG